jgi:hypothetical protein
MPLNKHVHHKQDLLCVSIRSRLLLNRVIKFVASTSSFVTSFSLLHTSIYRVFPKSGYNFLNARISAVLGLIKIFLGTFESPIII